MKPSTPVVGDYCNRYFGLDMCKLLNFADIFLKLFIACLKITVVLIL